MKFIFKNIWQLIAFVLLLVIVIQNSCSRTPKPKPDVVTEIPTIEINATSSNYVPEPKIVILTKTKTVTKWRVKWKIKWEKEKMDSVKVKELYQKYYGIYVYDENVVDTNNVKVRVVDSISENKIMSRQVYWTIIPQVYEKKVTIPPRIKLYAGFAMGGGIDQFGFAPKLFMTDKKNHVYTLSYNVITRYTEVSVGWLISFRKKR